MIFPYVSLRTPLKKNSKLQKRTKLILRNPCCETKEETSGNVVNFIHPEKKPTSQPPPNHHHLILPLSLLFFLLPPPSLLQDTAELGYRHECDEPPWGRAREREGEGERERVPRRGGCQQCNEWRSILSLGQARAFTPRCSPGDTEPRVVARGITGGVLTLGRGGERGWVAHGTLPSADRGATYASHPFVRNDDGVHPSWASSFSDGLDPIPLAN